MAAAGGENPTDEIADCVNACGDDIDCILNCVYPSDPSDD
jgi:hypothetical protein